MLSKIKLGSLIPVILIVLSLLRGGREIIGLVVFYILSLVLIILLLRKEDAFFCRTSLDLPLAVLFIVISISTTISVVTRMKGIVHFLSFVVFILLFYSVVRLREEQLLQEFFIVFITICSMLSIAVCLEGIFKWKDFVTRTILPHANFPNHNLLAGFIAPGIIVTLCFIMSSRVYNIKIKILLWLSLALMLASQLFTFSRGAWIAIIAGVLFLFMFNYRKLLIPIMVLIAFCLFALILIPESYIIKWVGHKFFSQQGTARSIIWQVGLNASLARPILGWGLGSFAQVYHKFKIPCEWEIARYGRYTRFAHNEYLDCAVENGILGLGIFIWLIVTSLKEGIKLLKSSTDDYWLKAACVAGTVTISVHSFFDFNLHLPAITFLLVTFVGNYIPRGTPVKLTKAANRLFKIAISVIIGIILLVSFSFYFAHKGAQIKTENKQKAKNFYKITTILNPFYSNNWVQRAHLETVPNKKEKFFMQATKVDPKNFQLYSDIARYYVSVNNLDQAINNYNKAIVLNPYNPFLYSELADIYLGGNQFKEAFRLYNRAVELEPTYVLGHYRLSEILYKLNQKSSAKKELETIIKIKELNLIPDSDYTRRMLRFNYNE